MNGTQIDWWWMVGLVIVIALIWLLVKNLSPRQKPGSNSIDKSEPETMQGNATRVETDSDEKINKIQ
jgi:putative membrane protein